MVEVFKNLDWSVLTNILLGVIPSLICITLHELSHGYVAYRLGDNTAKNAGRLTLNPIKHIDPFGLVMMAVFHFGWARAVPVNMRNFKNPKKGMAITALAGPAMNILITVAFLFLYGLLYAPLSRYDWGKYVLQMVYLTSYISIALAIFNFLPIPPLDGSKILFSLLTDRQYVTLMRYERYGMMILLALVWSGILGTPLSNAVGFVYDRLFFIAEFANKLTL